LRKKKTWKSTQIIPNQPNLTKEISNSHPNHQSHHRCRPVAGSDAAGWPLPEFPGAEGRLTPRGARAIFWNCYTLNSIESSVFDINFGEFKNFSNRERVFSFCPSPLWRFSILLQYHLRWLAVVSITTMAPKA